MISPALSRGGQGRAGRQAGGRRQGREGRSILRCISPSLLHSSTTLPSPLYSLHPQTSPDIIIHGSARVSINILTSTSSPCCRRTSFSSTPRTGVISCQLVPISECECDKASQDLAGEQNRVVAHASYLLSFKPLHTISSAQDQLRRPLQRARLLARLDSTRGWRFFPRPPRGSTESTPSVRLPSPHPDNQNHTSAALSLTPPRPQTTPCLRRTTPLRPAFLLKISPPSCRRSSPQTQFWNLDSPLNGTT